MLFKANISFSYYNGMSDVSFLQHNFDINMTYKLEKIACHYTL